MVLPLRDDSDECFFFHPGGKLVSPSIVIFFPLHIFML